MADAFLGQIEPVCFNFPPRDWAACDGQLYPISQHSALFSLLSTTFGGAGRATFGLPDLRGRVARHPNKDGALTKVAWGEAGGSESVVLIPAGLPSHNHPLYAYAGFGDTLEPQNAHLAADSSGRDLIWWKADGSSAKQLDANSNESMGKTGGGQAFSIRNPFLALYFNIAIQGIFPTRS